MKHINHKIASVLTVAATMISADNAFANNLSASSDLLVQNVSKVSTITSAVAYGAGTILGVGGILGLKAHLENPQSASVKSVVGKLGGGVLCLSAPTLFDTIQNSVFGSQNAGGINSAEMKIGQFN